MANEQITVLVLKDSTGDYFLVPPKMLEGGRVPAEHKADVERLISEQHDDVQGYNPMFIGGMIVGSATTLVGIGIGYGVVKWLMD